jgi:phage tail-like protein
VRKLPGLNKFGNVTLKRGITDSMDLYNWYKDVVAGKIKRQNVAIVVLDEEGKDKARFQITDAWPNKYDPMDLNAKGNDVSIETMELVNEGVQRTA